MFQANNNKTVKVKKKTKKKCEKFECIKKNLQHYTLNGFAAESQRKMFAL